jgi:hypothetical protein
MLIPKNVPKMSITQLSIKNLFLYKGYNINFLSIFFKPLFPSPLPYHLYNKKAPDIPELFIFKNYLSAIATLIIIAHSTRFLSISQESFTGLLMSLLKL